MCGLQYSYRYTHMFGTLIAQMSLVKNWVELYLYRVPDPSGRRMQAVKDRYEMAFSTLANITGSIAETPPLVRTV